MKHQHHLSVTELEARARLVKTNADFKAKIAKVAARLEAEMSQALNQQKDLEQSALSPMLNETASQKKWRADFNAASTWDERLRLMQHLKKSFNDKSKKNPDIINYQFSQRLLFAEAKEQMHADVLAQFNLAVAKRVLNDDANAPYMTIPKAKRILDEVAQKRDAGDAKFKDVTDQELRVLKLYYTSLEKEFLAYLKPNMSVPPNSL